MQAKLIVSFERLSEADFLAKSGFIIASLSGNANFSEPWPAQVPSLAQLTEAYQAYEDAYHASLSRDKQKIAQRELARETLIALLKRLVPYLDLIAQGDTSILASSGFDMRHDGVHSGSGTLPAPSDFSVSHGLHHGTLLLHAAKIPAARSYEVQTTQGDPTVEANWSHALTSATASRILLEGLTPAQTYWVRLRAVGSQGAGVWSDPLSAIVV